MPFKFEKLEVWQLALDYIDLMYEIANQLPKGEDYNLRSQMIRAATSIALNIAEGSTGQTDVEQARFVGLAIRSTLETVACQHLINRRKYFSNPALLLPAYSQAETLVAKLHNLRKAIAPEQKWLREEPGTYSTANE
ncbi:MAG: four helix bundle protein [Anaerolineales bacterium]